MLLIVNSSALRTASTTLRSKKDAVYLNNLQQVQNQWSPKAGQVVPRGEAESVLQELIAKTMSKAHQYASQIDSHCNFLLSAADSYEQAEQRLVQMALSLPTAFGWKD